MTKYFTLFILLPGRMLSLSRLLFSSMLCLSFFSAALLANPNPDVLPLSNFQVAGKVAFHRYSKGGNANLFWQQQGSHYHIQLIGALGAGTLEIYGRPGFVGLVQSNGESYKAANPEQLIRKVLGWDIPVSPLRYWLQGQVVPEAKVDRLQRDAQGNLIYLQQLGWSIQYEKCILQGERLLPSRIVMQRGPIRLKFIFKNWEF